MSCFPFKEINESKESLVGRKFVKYSPLLVSLVTIQSRTFSSRLLTKNVKIRVYNTIILPVVSVWVGYLGSDIKRGT
jgi:hypothetical protein